MQLAFLHLNLKRNPFGEITEDERARLAVVDIDRILAALQNPHCAVQFLGEKGYGKTTHLIALRSRLSGAGYVHIPEGETRPLPEGNPIMIDEAQRLTWWQQKTLFRKKVPLVLGTHRNFELSLKKQGRTVQTIDVGDLNSLNRIQTLLHNRIEFVRRTDGPVPTVGHRTVRQLQKKYGSDIRAILYELYQRLQKLEAIDEL